LRSTNNPEVNMESPDSHPIPTAVTQETRPAPRRKAPARPKAAAARRPAAKKKANGKPAPDLWTDLVSGRAHAAGVKLARLSRDGAITARRKLDDVKGLSKKTAKRLSRDWKAMSTKRRVQLVATLVAALGAAAVPLVTRRLKKR
jgi:hypothetical protein